MSPDTLATIATAAVLLAIAAFAAALALLALGAGPALPLIIWALLAYAALLEWLACRQHAADYHRHRYEHAKCHARPTRRHRARLFVRRVRPSLLRPAAPGGALATIPDALNTVRTA